MKKEKIISATIFMIFISLIQLINAVSINNPNIPLVQSAVTTSQTYFPTTIQTLRGTNTTISNISFVSTAYDGLSYNVTEGSGADPLDVRFNFTGVEDFDFGATVVWYDGSTSHIIEICLWNYVTSAWNCNWQITDGATYELVSGSVFNSQNYIQNGLVQVRYNHIQNGVNTHKLYIDYIAISKGGSILISNEHDALSGRSDILTNHPNSADVFYSVSNPNNYLNDTTATSSGYAKYNFDGFSFNGSGNFTTTGNGTFNRIGVGKNPDSKTLISGYITGDSVSGMDLNVSTSDSGGGGKNGIKITYANTNGGNIGYVFLINASTNPATNTYGIFQNWISGGAGSLIKPYEVTVTTGGSLNMMRNIINGTSTTVGIEKVSYALGSIYGINSLLYGNDYDLTDYGGNFVGNTLYGNNIKLTSQTSTGYAVGGTSYGDKVDYTANNNVADTSYLFYGTNKFNNTDDTAYMLFLDNLNTATVNKPTANQIGIYVDNDMLGNDTGDKRFAIFNAGTNINSSDVLIAKDNVQVYYGWNGTRGRSSIYSDGLNLRVTPNITNSTSSIFYIDTNISALNVIDRSVYWDYDYGDALDNLKLTEEINDNDSNLNTFEQAKYKVINNSNCWQVLDHYEYCYIINTTKLSANESALFNVSEITQECSLQRKTDWANYKTYTKGYTDILSETITQINLTQCGAKEETGRLISATVGKHEQALAELRTASDVWKLEGIDSPVLATPQGIATETIYMMSEGYKAPLTKTDDQILSELTRTHYDDKGNLNYSSYGDVALKTNLTTSQKDSGGKSVEVKEVKDLINVMQYIGKLETQLTIVKDKLLDTITRLSNAEKTITEQNNRIAIMEEEDMRIKNCAKESEEYKQYKECLLK